MVQAVLTGDIVSSTKMKAQELDFLQNVLRDEAHELEKQGVLSSIQFFRGDSFQVLVLKPEEALRVALLLKSLINSSFIGFLEAKSSKIRYDIAISVGLGNVSDDPIGGELNTRPYILSGRGLDYLKENKLTIGVFTGHEENDLTYKTMFELFHWIMKQWSMFSAEVIYHKLNNQTEQQIAQKLGVSQPAINQRSQAACWNGIVEMLNHFKQVGVMKYD